jgi:electron transfer flavoprotein beta subunit
MNILIFMKQVPDTQKVRIDPERGTLIRKGVPSVTNPFDETTLELALELRERVGGSITALTMGIPDAESILRDALTLGADRAWLLTHRAFAGSDTLATSYTLAAAARSIGGFDLYLFGKQATDGDTAQVGPEFAGHLDLPVVTFVDRVVDVDEGRIVVERMIDSGRQVVEASFPAVLTVVKSARRLRMPTFDTISRSFGKPLDRLGVDDIGADPDRCGLTGSPTRVKKVFSPGGHARVRFLGGTPQESARELMTAFREKNLL